MGVETGFCEGAVSSALMRCHLPRVSVQRPSTVLFSVCQSKQDTCDRKLNRQVVFLFACLLFVETKGTINKLWELHFNFLKNF